MALFRNLAALARLGLVRTFGGVVRRVEPRGDAGYMAKQHEKGELVWQAFVDAGKALRRAERFDEADAMMARGLSVFPGDRTLLYEYAFSAHSAGRYALAIERWRAALVAAPDVAMCHAGVAANLRETGDLGDAAEVIAGAMRRFPDDLTVLSEAARIADARLRFSESLPLWRRASAMPNPPSDWLQGEAHALLRLGHFDEAEAVAAAARARYPDAPGLLAVQGLLAAERRRWADAVAIWTDYRRRFPQDDMGREQYERAKREAASSAVPNIEDPTTEDPNTEDYRSTGSLLAGFASLGDSGDFERIQARCGALDDDLPCWHDVPLDGLMAALGERFDGLGARANTEIDATAGGAILRDQRWGLALRVGLPEGAVDRDHALEAACRAVEAHRDRLVADLASAEKIVVYRSSEVDADRLDALHRALCRFGPVRLMTVQSAAPTAPTLLQGAAGELVRLGPGCFVGFLEKLADSDGDTDAAAQDWIALCRKVELAR